MITLITGVPGSGKTAYALKMMLDFVGSDVRPLFVHGIPELKLPHEVVKCRSLSCDVCPKLPGDDYLIAEDWHKWAPDGGVLFFDEVQNVHRPRSSASKVPDVIAAYEVHRHRGLDFYLITQHPKLFDSNVRHLVSKHIHLTANWLKRIQYEWSECSESLSNTSTAVKSSYVLDKKVFPLYKSASLHTTVKRKKPMALYAVIALVVLITGVSYRFYTKRVVVNPADSTPVNQPVSSSSSVVNNAQPIPALDKRLDFNPVVPGHPESAPAFEQVAIVQDFPQLAGCIASETKCSCYTQQATKMPIPEQNCRDLARNPPFNPYKPKKLINQPQPIQQPQKLAQIEQSPNISPSTQF